MHEITSIKKLEKQLRKLYFFDVLVSGEHYPVHYTRAKSYFKFIHGGKRRPYLYRLANCIPDLELKRTHKLLPLHSKKGGCSYSNFIEVPKKIIAYTQITPILKQLKPISGKNCTIKKKEEALGYILGMMVSDTSKPNGYRFSKQCLLALTRRYSWCLDVGNYLSSCFNLLGIKAHRIRDNDRIRKRAPYGEFRWITEKSVFITYLLEGMLGLKKGEITTFDNVDVDWILYSPSYFSLAFLQGLCDGDGSAHNFWRIEISCDPNKKFVVKLLKRLGMISYVDGDSVTISNEKSIEVAYSLPIFLNAHGRMVKLKQILEMYENRLYFRDAPKILRDMVVEFKKQGLSGGNISEIFFEKYGFGVHPNSINDFYRKSLR